MTEASAPTGHTRLFFILADPIDHVRAPVFFNPAFAARGSDAFLVPLHVPAGTLGLALDALQRFPNVGGVVLTIPHKEAAVPLCTCVSSAGRLCGAINAIRFAPDGGRVGAQFDGIGFVEALRAEGMPVEDRRILIAGTGGAGRAMAFALAAEAPAKLTLANRTRRKAEALAAEIRAAYPTVAVEAGDADPDGFDLVVNATSLGLHDDDPEPVRFAQLRVGMDVADIVVTPEWTPLRRAARDAGCRSMGGKRMIDHQLDALTHFLCG